MLNNEVLNNDDPWASAGVTQTQSKFYIGQVWFDLWFCITEKGGANKGRPQFDPVLHSPKNRRTAINLSITALKSSKYQNPTERQYVQEFGNWQKYVLPSIKAILPDVEEKNLLRQFNSKFALYELVQVGSYEKDGVTKYLTEPVFVKMFDTEQEAENAAAELYGTGNGNGNNHTEPTPAPNGNAEREVALKFLPALATQAGKDPLKLSELIASNGLVSKYFDINSPEVIAVLS